MDNKDTFVNEAIDLYKAEHNLDNALEQKVGCIWQV